jgi:hypothetical protein
MVTIPKELLCAIGQLQLSSHRYNAVRKLSSSYLLSKNLMCSTIIISAVLYREENKSRVFEKRVLRRTYGSTKLEVKGGKFLGSTFELVLLHMPELRKSRRNGRIMKYHEYYYKSKQYLSLEN